MHQTGLNSGVMHMGLYYKPGSLRAKLCVEGGELMYKYLDQKGIPYKKCGKVIVALDDEEVSALKEIYATACTNKCKGIQLISAEQLRKLEPHCRVSQQQKLFKSTCVVDDTAHPRYDLCRQVVCSYFPSA